MGEEADAGLYAHLAVLPFESEFLLIDGGGGKEGCLYALAEPVGKVRTLGDGFEGFAFVLNALCDAYLKDKQVNQKASTYKSTEKSSLFLPLIVALTDTFFLVLNIINAV